MTIHWLYQNRIAMPRSWQDTVQAAETEADVLDVARDFLAQFSPSEIAQLPEACRPRRLFDAADIAEYAFALVRHRCDYSTGAGSTLQRLSAFFMDANERLSQILLSQRSGNDEHHDQRYSA